MGPVTQSLIIGTSEFSAEDLADLEKQSDYLVGAKVVYSLDELSKCLDHQKYTLVLHLCNAHPDQVSPSDALKRVIQNSRNIPFVVIGIGKGLPDAQAVDLVAAGAADCMMANDDRSIDDVVRRAVGPYRHLRLVPSSKPAFHDINKVFEALGEGIAILDGDLLIRSFNPALLTDTGYDADDLTDAPVFVLDDGNTRQQLEASKNKASEWRGDINIRRKDGSVYPAWAVMSPITGSPLNQTPDGFVLLISDMTECKQLDQEMRQQANLDALTQLPNRSLLQDRVTQALATAKRTGTRVATMFIDLDHFKNINDTWGHATGDAMLVEAAARMQACVRESDTVARIGGDEFAVILTDMREDQFADKVASKIAGALERPFLLQGAALYLSASIGIAIYPIHGTSSETLFENADAAMYAVKRNGRRGYRLFGDMEGVSSVAPIAASLGHATSQQAPEPRTYFDRLRNAISNRTIFLPIRLIPAGVASACVLVVVGWLFATGAISVQLGPTEVLTTGNDMNLFGTASGTEELDTLPELQELSPN